MPTTRSSSKKQAKLDDFVDDNQPGSSSSNTKSGSTKAKANIASDSSKKSAKRKQDGQHDSKSASTTKKQKQQHVASNGTQELESPIVINRAPVLQLWGTVVAHFLRPDLSWQACLSIGNAISALCAISKGKAIGMIQPKDDADSAERKKEKKETEQNSKEVSVMGFPLHLKNDAVLMSGKPKPFSEGTLKSKFGEAQYEAAKKAMSENLESWSNDKDELDKKAFHMYEKFRPNVATGQKGWGRKGELNLHEVASVIKRSAE